MFMVQRSYTKQAIIILQCIGVMVWVVLRIEKQFFFEMVQVMRKTDFFY